MPDDALSLERQPGADTEDYAGLEDEVDNHWGMVFKVAVLPTLLSAETRRPSIAFHQALDSHAIRFRGHP